MESWRVALHVIVRVCISTIGIGGNSFVLYVILKAHNLRDSTIKLIANLSMSDVVTALLFSTVSVSSELVKESFYGCLIVCLLVHYTIFVSLFTLSITTVDRYLAICHHDRYATIMTKKRVFALIITAWVYPLPLLSIPFFGFTSWNKESTCALENILHSWIYKTYSSLVITLILITLGLYIRILIKAREFQRGFHPAQTVGINITSMRVRAKKRAIKNGRVIGIVTLFFIVCWLPFHILQFGFSPENENLSLAAAVTGGLGTFNALVNPFLYAWQRRDFRKSAKRLSCHSITNRKNEINGCKRREEDNCTPFDIMTGKQGNEKKQNDDTIRKQNVCTIKTT
ncbi:hypothetical protein FSP39_019361 [Pinctada imbricata]|uniref:G-protein coupled receptors family 1 profile domain-containing protein n=1 Tax=Pinctada imbricata TaxID=66713 RepID=A0AA88YIW3_PINIB|nr:hypothetical protein FSP39_019361 [Pinctada imbricata]